MNQQNPQQPPPPPAGGSTPGGTTSTGLDPKLAGLLCYILGLITGLIFFLIEKTNQTVRFHAAQSIVFSIAWVVVWVLLGIVGLILGQISYALGNLFGILSLLVWLGLFIVWIVLLVKGYSGERWKLPLLGDIADRMVAGGAAR